MACSARAALGTKEHMCVRQILFLRYVYLIFVICVLQDLCVHLVWHPIAKLYHTC
jgi:hypothetical protein